MSSNLSVRFRSLSVTANLSSSSEYQLYKCPEILSAAFEASWPRFACIRHPKPQPMIRVLERFLRQRRFFSHPAEALDLFMQHHAASLRHDAVL